MNSTEKPAPVRKLYREGVSKAEVARRLQISRTSVHRILTERLSHAHEED
jgi:DNA-binding transcriptional regulator LsrR (DeoR family)